MSGHRYGHGLSLVDNQCLAYSAHELPATLRGGDGGRQGIPGSRGAVGEGTLGGRQMTLGQL